MAGLSRPLLVPDADNDAADAPKKRKRPWRQKFGDAVRGLKKGIRGHSSFFVHFFVAALVISTGFVLNCEPLEWCILVFCIGFVLTAELFNSAIETLFRGFDEQTKDKSWPALDIAAGAVLMASITAAIIGVIVFVHRLLANSSIQQ
jgi:diacylglycerol kinase